MKKIKSNKSLQKQPTESLSKLLKKTGFLLPTTEDEVEANEKISGKTDIILPKEVDDPSFIFKRMRESGSDTLPNNKDGKLISSKTFSKDKNDYFKKLVLAAKIVSELCTEPTFGHVKLVKVYFVCEEVCLIHLSTNYGQHIAGPLDGKLLHIIDSEFKKRNWFKVVLRKGGKGYKYEKGEKANEYERYYSSYFPHTSNSITRVIELLRHKTTDFCEIVATCFAVWEKCLEEQLVVTNSIIVERFYNWSKEKKKFSQKQITDVIDWMKENQITPIV